ncbi:unnamed protein product [Microthlaspi erraticum]|uniref:Uncharacterized protein n=1 Tax=Microthlaspi erraticum TaxID=1685480 RepID=A0A6D2HQV2_9BRAS|nr:unnamed protein product [Microthlaspi erraticum]
MFVSKIVVRRNGDGPPQIIRKLKRLSAVASEAVYDDDYVDPAAEEGYKRQVRESDGFDVDECPLPDGGIRPYVFDDKYDYKLDVGLYGRLGLHCYNLEKGTNLKLIGINKYNSEWTGVYVKYITLEAMDTSNNSPCVFQTCVCKYISSEDASLLVQTELSRLRVPIGPRASPIGLERGFEESEVDEFYKGKMPSWLTQKDMAQFYELKESEVQEYEWLHLYAEFGFALKWITYGKALKSYLPLQINKVTIRTKENGQESPLKAKNAIFYISFKGNGDPSGMLVEYQAVVRRTMDGMPGHIRLEVDCLSYESN